MIYTRTSDNFRIDNEQFKIEFNHSLDLNQILYIDHLTRKKEKWETDIEYKTLFHYFNYKIDNLISVFPTIFVFNNISKDEYPIRILFANEEDKQIYNSYQNLRNCIEHYNIENYDKCIDWEKGNFLLNKAQNYEISIGNDLNYAIIKIAFIYYKLSEESRKCQTKTFHMDNIIKFQL